MEKVSTSNVQKNYITSSWSYEVFVTIPNPILTPRINGMLYQARETKVYMAKSLMLWNGYRKSYNSI
mgnify:FL=1